MSRPTTANGPDPVSGAVPTPARHSDDARTVRDRLVRELAERGIDHTAELSHHPIEADVETITVTLPLGEAALLAIILAG